MNSVETNAPHDIIEPLSWDHYAKEPGGELLPQVSATAVIENIVRRADVRAGHRILEIGTGSGYSAALLGRIIGAQGRVTSIEIVPELVTRARERLERDGVRNVDLHAADGRHGLRSAAPFDRVIAWATPAGAIPPAWLDQLAEGGLLLVPTHLAPAAACIAVAVLTRRDGTLSGVGFVRGSFAPLDDEPRHQWRGPLSDRDHGEDDEDGPLRWISAPWLRELDPAERRRRGSALLDGGVVEAAPSEMAEAGSGLWASLLISRPADLTTSFSRDVGVSVGHSSPAGMALLSISGQKLTQCGDDRYLARLRASIEEWQACGRPTLDDLEPRVAHDPDGVHVIAGHAEPPEA